MRGSAHAWAPPRASRSLSQRDHCHERRSPDRAASRAAPGPPGDDHPPPSTTPTVQPRASAGGRPRLLRGRARPALDAREVRRRARRSATGGESSRAAASGVSSRRGAHPSECGCAGRRHLLQLGACRAVGPFAPVSAASSYGPDPRVRRGWRRAMAEFERGTVRANELNFEYLTMGDGRSRCACTASLTRPTATATSCRRSPRRVTGRLRRSTGGSLPPSCPGTGTTCTAARWWPTRMHCTRRSGAVTTRSSSRTTGVRWELGARQRRRRTGGGAASS